MADTTARLDLRSLRAWDNFRQRVVELGGEVLETAWLGATVRYACRCSAGHSCFVSPHKLGQGRRLCTICPRSVSIAAEQKFRDSVLAAGGRVIGTWVDNRTPIEVICRSGHACHPYPTGVIQGNGFCRECARMSPEGAEQRFREQVALIGGAVVGSWAGSNSSIHCVCPVGHDCYPCPGSLVKGQGLCRHCGGPTPESAEQEFRQNLVDAGAVLLEGFYLGSTAQHRIICPQGHATTVAPVVVRQSGVYCSACPVARSVASEQAFIAALIRHGATYVGPWNGCDQPAALICAEGHRVTTRPFQLTRGNGPCRVCAGKLWDVLYVVRNLVTRCVKFGITSGDSRPRLSDHRRNGFTELVYLRTGLTEGVAATTEKKIKVALNIAGEKPMQGYEYFSDDNITLIINEISIWIT